MLYFLSSDIFIINFFIKNVLNYFLQYHQDVRGMTDQIVQSFGGYRYSSVLRHSSVLDTVFLDFAMFLAVFLRILVFLDITLFFDIVVFLDIALFVELFLMNTLQFKVHTLKILLSFFNRLASRNSSLFVWDR